MDASIANGCQYCEWMPVLRMDPEQSPLESCCARSPVSARANRLMPGIFGARYCRICGALIEKNHSEKHATLRNHNRVLYAFPADDARFWEVAVRPGGRLPARRPRLHPEGRLRCECHLRQHSAHRGLAVVSGSLPTCQIFVDRNESSGKKYRYARVRPIKEESRSGCANCLSGD